MNEQEMQFAEPDWQPANQTPLEGEKTGPLLPSAKSAESMLNQNLSETVYEQGYRGYLPREFAVSTPEMVTEKRRVIPRRALWGIWVFAALLLLALVGGMFGYASLYGGYHHHHRHRHEDFGMPVQGVLGQTLNTYTLAGASQVVVANPLGSITIQVDNTNTNTVKVKTEGFQTNAAYEGNSLLLAPVMGEGTGNMLITVPQNIALNLRTTQGDILVSSFNGQVIAQSYSGALIFNSDHLAGQSLLSSYSGNIQMQQGSVSEFATLSDYAGSLFLNQEKLSGHLVLRAGADAAINFSGELDSLGRYEFITNSGAIDLALPANTVMQIEKTDVLGTYHSDFASSNSAGNAPQAEVIVRTMGGAVTIRKQS